jgi:O-antigen/teichoic acid export membrane protein
VAGVADPVPLTEAGPRVSASTVRRIARNASIPALASLVNRLLDFAFFIFLARQLTPDQLGRYSWAVLTVGYLDILVNFGLGILLTRDVARQPELAARYLGAGMVLRLMLWVLALGLSALVGGPFAGLLAADAESAFALSLLTIGIGISNQFGLLSALFAARERMEYPAYVTVVTTLLKIAAGATAIAAGYGIVGLAGASILVNICSGVILLAIYVRVLGWPFVDVSAGTTRHMSVDSIPLMLNNLLASFFFRVDGLLLKPMAGDVAVATYSAAYRFIDGLTVISSTLVLAMFPALSRAAAAGATPERPNARLHAATYHGLRALHALAIPLAVGVTLLAETVVVTFVGPDYVPGSVIALQILVWYLPFSFTNGLLQYVLIAADRKRLITVAFLIAAIFNVTANLLAIPRFGFVGAAVVTVLSEIVLLGPFWWGTRRCIGELHLLVTFWRPAIAAAGMALIVWPLQGQAWLAVLAGATSYAVGLLLLGTIRPSERQAVGRWLRERWGFPT